MNSINRFYINQPIQYWARTVLASEVNRLQYEIDCTKEQLNDIFAQDNNNNFYRDLTKSLKNRLRHLKIRMHRLSNTVRKVKIGELDDSAVRVIKNSAQTELSIRMDLSNYYIGKERQRRILKSHEYRMSNFKRHLAKQQHAKQLVKAVNRMILA